MYDVYLRVDDSFERLVVWSNTQLPNSFEKNDWKLAGTVRSANDDIERDIRAHGYYRYRTNISFSENENTIGKMPK